MNDRYDKLNRIKKKLADMLINDSLDIHHKLLNLMLTIILIGTIVGLLFSLLFLNAGWTNLLTFMVGVCVAIALHISVMRKKQDLAAVIISIVVNALLLPAMYLTQGGMNSGLPIWMLLGLTFNWLVLSGVKCYITFGIEAVVDFFVFNYEYHFPEKIEHLAADKMMADIFECVFVVALIFGAIFKFQTAVYERQKKDLEEREADIRNAMKELEIANKAKSSFLANMSHEIRTPINAVLGMDELILREDVSPEVRGYANNIDRSGKLLLSLINDILDLSKIESGKMEIFPDKYNTSDLMLDCYSNIKFRAQDKGLRLKVICDEKLPSVLEGDEIRVRQIITNILTNAVKYTEKGFVKVKIGFVETDATHIELMVDVTDSGKGISPENIETLFDSFKRVDDKSNRSIEGTGLGLAITKKLLQLMNGSITVESTVGKGSTFKIIIPQHVINKEPIGSWEEISKAAAAKINTYKEKLKAPDAHIMVVDDVKINLMVVEGLLRETDVNVDSALSGAECIEKLKANKYDIILMDHMMPEMDGIETLHAIKEQKLIDDSTKVVALTANAIVGAKESYLAEGFDDYLTKPIKGEVLENMLIQYLPPELVKMTQE